MKRRTNSLSAEFGLAVALIAVVAAFSLDVQPNTTASRVYHDAPDDPINVVQPPQTIQQRTIQPTRVRIDDVPPVPVDREAELIKRFLPSIPIPTGVTATTLTEPPDPPSQDPPVADPEPAYVEPPFLPYAEVMPELIGGLSALQASITYPEFAQRVGIEGRVILKFIVNTDGTVSDVEVTRGIGGGCDEEAVEAIKNARFTPGRQSGRPVRVRFALPVTFRLS